MTSPRRPETRRPDRWRWVAHPPWRPPLPVQRPPVPRTRTGPAWADRTPAYPSTPRWGLPPVVVAPPAEESPERRRRLSAVLAGWTGAILSTAWGWLLGSAVIHLLRYAALAWYADRVAPWWLEAATRVLVTAAGGVALIVCVASAVTATAWLVEARREAYAPARDPRHPISLWAGCLLPVVTYLRTPVHLEELRRASTRAPSRARLRRWWAVWALNGLAVALALWRGSDEGPQAAADTVLLTALALLVAVWAVRETRAVMRSFGDPSPRFTRRLLVRGIVNASPAREENP